MTKNKHASKKKSFFSTSVIDSTKSNGKKNCNNKNVLQKMDTPELIIPKLKQSLLILQGPGNKRKKVVGKKT